jgi:hypothetical protein
LRGLSSHDNNNNNKGAYFFKTRSGDFFLVGEGEGVGWFMYYYTDHKSITIPPNAEKIDSLDSSEGILNPM